MRITLGFLLLHASLCAAVPFSRHNAILTAVKARVPDSIKTIVNSLHVSEHQGLSLFPCSSNSDCEGDRSCATATDTGFGPCSGPCFCVPADPSTLLCSSDADCDDGEICFDAPNAPGTMLCVDESIAGGTSSDDTTSPSDDSNSGGGLTGELCSDDSDCADTRVCGDAQGTDRCLPQTPTICTDDSDCVEGEVCVELDVGEVCISAAIAPPSTATTDAPPTSEVGTEPSDDATSGGSTSGGGLTGELCSDDSDCADTRVCGDVQGTDRCSPQTPTICTDDSDCVDGEVCVELDGGEVCISAAIAPPSTTTTDAPSTSEVGTEPPITPPTEASTTSDTSSTDSSSDSSSDSDTDSSPLAGLDGIPSPEEGEENAPCIAADSLSHLSAEQLVFEKHIVSHVLCDMDESCATPGHIVRYKGKGMMMKSYCGMKGDCVWKIMNVNSPRYTRGLIVPSRSEDLVFTALAARS